MIRKIGARFDKRVIEIETNLRGHSYILTFDGFTPTELFLQALATFCPCFFGGFIFPLLIPMLMLISSLGSHPALDPLWSTETLEFVHDGCEATRIEKVALIAEPDVALKFLRVCGEDHNGAYNCGWCEKCIRTKINFISLGRLTVVPPSITNSIQSILKK